MPESSKQLSQKITMCYITFDNKFIFSLLLSFICNPSDTETNDGQNGMGLFWYRSLYVRVPLMAWLFLSLESCISSQFQSYDRKQVYQLRPTFLPCVKKIVDHSIEINQSSEIEMKYPCVILKC